MHKPNVFTPAVFRESVQENVHFSGILIAKITHSAHNNICYKICFTPQIHVLFGCLE